MKLFAAACVAAVATAQQIKPFGTGLSQGTLNATEQSLFAYTLTEGSTHGVLTHWWITGGPSIDFTLIRIYVDGEVNASLTFTPPMACGVGFRDQQAPWSTDWFGKNAQIGAWVNNFRVPFQQSINITYQQGPGGVATDTIYMIVRGSENLPMVIGGVALPATARLGLTVVDRALQPLEWVDVISAPAGTVGMAFTHTLSYAGVNLNTLEGCYHAYTPANAPFPGFLVSTGTEDYFDSAYYFSSGRFWGPNAGLTHIQVNSTHAEMSAYRFHVSDPIVFNDGFRLTWRNGDVTDPATGLKCTLETGGNPVGNPQVAQVLSYGWFYTW